MKLPCWFGWHRLAYALGLLPWALKERQMVMHCAACGKFWLVPAATPEGKS